jgi:hypothetical protein
MHKKIVLIFLSMTLIFCLQPSGATADGQSGVSQIPKEVMDLTGTFTGAWALFGIDETGQPVKKMAWTDIIEAENPAVKGDRAYVTTTDEMSFEGGKIPPMKVTGAEGYFINPGGGLGNYFIESMGQTYSVLKLSDNVWTYTMSASPQELAYLGFSKTISGQHVIVKVVGREEGKETHRISRLTTVKWRDAEGKEKWIQYLSLQGFHKRQ